ncbi:MAG: hypothetical protein SPH23_05850 [Prevotella sp.]|nr:hypothetical protein [Prevotellaceae bacterium]MDY5250371.1 hypothetical protein [Prevotella sp.]
MNANALAPSGRTSSLHHTQGDALGYVLVAPSGRAFIATSYPWAMRLLGFQPAP